MQVTYQLSLEGVTLLYPHAYELYPVLRLNGWARGFPEKATKKAYSREELRLFAHCLKTVECLLVTRTMLVLSGELRASGSLRRWRLGHGNRQPLWNTDACRGEAAELRLTEMSWAQLTSGRGARANERTMPVPLPVTSASPTDCTELAKDALCAASPPMVK